MCDKQYVDHTCISWWRCVCERCLGDGEGELELCRDGVSILYVWHVCTARQTCIGVCERVNLPVQGRESARVLSLQEQHRGRVGHRLCLVH